MTHPVGLVHDWLTGMRGGEKVLEAIARLFPGAPIYTLFHFPGSVSPAIEEHPIVTSFLQGAPGVERWYRNYLPLFPRAAEELPVGDHRLLISSSHCVAKGAIPGPGARHLCYCHTPVRYAWDQEEAYFPDRRGAVALVRRRVLAGLRRWDVRSAPRVHQFVANSSFVAGRIARYYGRQAEVLPPPVDLEAFPVAPAGEPRRHVLMVAALAPYKKVEVAIQACGRLGIELVVVGTGPERARLERLAGPGTRLAGRVSDAELAALYRQAICFIQPGIEDFGIATVEALASGTPVVALAEGGVLDIVESGRHGLLYTAHEGDPAAALAAAIDKSRGMQFNLVNLRSRAERFAAPLFAARLRGTLVRFWPEAEELIA